MNFATGTNLLIKVVNVVDAAGNPATLTDVPVWTTSDPAILPLTPATDGMSTTGTSSKAGTVTVTATAGTISASVSITVESGVAVKFELAVSAV